MFFRWRPRWNRLASSASCFGHIKTTEQKVKGKGKCIYIAHFFVVPHAEGAQAWITQTFIQTPDSNRPLYSNTMIGTLAVDGWAVTFDTARPGRAVAPPSPLLGVPNVTAHLSTASVPNSCYLMWHYNCLSIVLMFRHCCWDSVTGIWSGGGGPRQIFWGVLKFSTSDSFIIY